MNLTNLISKPRFIPRASPTVSLWRVWQEVQGEPAQDRMASGDDHVQQACESYLDNDSTPYRREGIGDFIVDFLCDSHFPAGWYAIGENFVAGPYSHAVEAFSFDDIAHQAYYLNRQAEEQAA